MKKAHSKRRRYDRREIIKTILFVVLFAGAIWLMIATAEKPYEMVLDNYQKEVVSETDYFIIVQDSTNVRGEPIVNSSRENNGNSYGQLPENTIFRVDRHVRIDGPSPDPNNGYAIGFFVEDLPIWVTEHLDDECLEKDPDGIIWIFWSCMEAY